MIFYHELWDTYTLEDIYMIYEAFAVPKYNEYIISKRQASKLENKMRR